MTMRAIAAALLVALAAPLAHAETPKEKLARLAKEVFSYEEIDAVRIPTGVIQSDFGAAAGWCTPAPEEDYERSPDGSIARHYTLSDAYFPAKDAKRLFGRIEGTPGAFAVLSVEVTRDAKDASLLRGSFEVEAVGFDTAPDETATEGQVERVCKSIEAFIDRPLWGPPIVAALATATAHAVNVEEVRANAPKKSLALVVSAEAIGAASAYAAALGQDPAFAAFKKAVVKTEGPKRFSLTFARLDRAPSRSTRKRLVLRKLQSSPEGKEPRRSPAGPTGTAEPE
ncbi:MAG TPA: hypothetical protein VHF22_01045, partial [Planctomycetota bacterium]|nr:hypothetical protein [Planctomycetota bacterium]